MGYGTAEALEECGLGGVAITAGMGDTAGTVRFVAPGGFPGGGLGPVATTTFGDGDGDPSKRENADPPPPRDRFELGGTGFLSETFGTGGVGASRDPD